MKRLFILNEELLIARQTARFIHAPSPKDQTIEIMDFFNTQPKPQLCTYGFFLYISNNYIHTATISHSRVNHPQRSGAEKTHRIFARSGYGAHRESACHGEHGLIRTSRKYCGRFQTGSKTCITGANDKRSRRDRMIIASDGEHAGMVTAGMKRWEFFRVSEQEPGRAPPAPWEGKTINPDQRVFNGKDRSMVPPASPCGTEHAGIERNRRPIGG